MRTYAPEAIMPEQDISDKYYADEIRKRIKELNSIVCSAKKYGLDVQLNLHQLGEPNWVGYHDAAKIIRKY